MKDKRFSKLLLILISPVLIVLLAYSGLHFILVNVFNLPIEEMVIDYLGPIFVAISFSFLVVNRILKNLNLPKGTHNFIIWYYIPFTIMVPTMFAQKGLRAYTSSLKCIDNVDQIRPNDTVTYYRINSYFVDKSIQGLCESDQTIKWTTLYHHYVYPILRDSLDKNQPYVWYGLKFQKEIALLDINRNKLMKEFEVETQSKANENDFYSTNLFKRVAYNSDADRFRSAINAFEWTRQNQNIILIPIAETYEEIHENAFSMTISALIALILTGLMTGILVFSD